MPGDNLHMPYEAAFLAQKDSALTDSEQTRNRGLQLVVNPDTTHRVVDSTNVQAYFKKGE